MINDAFVKEVAGLARYPRKFESGGLNFVLQPSGPEDWKVFIPEQPDPECKPVTVTALSSLVAYVRDNRDELKLAKLALLATSGSVALVGPLTGNFRQRETFMVASIEGLRDSTEFHFGNFYDHEQFIIALQAKFVQTPERDALLAFVGKVSDETVRTSDDDGISQTVTGRAGVVLKQDMRVPNPVKLAPYRTFREVEQPESSFVLRLRPGRDENALPSCALFEADGGAWKVAAIKNVADYLRLAISGVPVYA